MLGRVTTLSPELLAEYETLMRYGYKRADALTAIGRADLIEPKP